MVWISFVPNTIDAEHFQWRSPAQVNERIPAVIADMGMDTPDVLMTDIVTCGDPALLLPDT